MNKYRLVIFDWEGTLADTLGQILHHLAIEAKKLDFGELDVVHARQFVGLGLDKAVKKMFPHLSEGQQQMLLSSVQQPNHLRQSEIYLLPGARMVVEYLHKSGVNLAIASNKGQQSLQKALQLSGLQPFFQVIRSAGQTSPKPCPQMLEEILVEFSLSYKEALMIGDSVSDIEMAMQMNMNAIGVDFYGQNTAPLYTAGALAVFNNYQELIELLKLKT